MAQWVKDLVLSLPWLWLLLHRFDPWVWGKKRERKRGKEGERERGRKEGQKKEERERMHCTGIDGVHFKDRGNSLPSRDINASSPSKELRLYCACANLSFSKS